MAFSLRSCYVNGVLTTASPRLCYDHGTSMPRCRRPHYVVNTFFRCLPRLWHVCSRFSPRLCHFWGIEYKYWIRFLTSSFLFQPPFNMYTQNPELLLQLVLLQGQQALLDAQVALVLVRRRRRRRNRKLAERMKKRSAWRSIYKERTDAVRTW